MAPPHKINTFGDKHVEELYKKAYHVLNKNLVINDADLKPFQSLNDLLFLTISSRT